MYDGLVFVRGLSKMVVSASTGRVVSAIIKNNVVAESKSERIRLAVATFALSGMVAKQASKWFDEEFDEAYETVVKFRNKNWHRATATDSEPALIPTVVIGSNHSD